MKKYTNLMIKRLFRCVDCNEIFMFTPYDSSPQYEIISSPHSFVEVYQNDRAHFINVHLSHNVIELSIDENSAVSGNTYNDPARTVLFQARDSKNSFAIKKWRNDAAVPYKCEVIGESVKTKIESMSVQEEMMRKQITADFPSLHRKIIEKMILLFKQATDAVRYNELSAIYEDDQNPLIEYGILKEKEVKKIAADSALLVNEDMEEVIVERFEDYSLPYGCMNLLVKKVIIVTKRKKGVKIIKFPAKDKLVDLRNVG